jgi:trimeric autotransporter adhesin
MGMNRKTNGMGKGTRSTTGLSRAALSMCVTAAALTLAITGAHAADRNTLVGDNAGHGSTISYSTYAGDVAGWQSTGTGGTAVGVAANAFTTGNYNTGLGIWAGSNTTGDQNTAVGMYSGAHVNGSNNSALGAYAGSNVNGGNNIAIGTNAGSSAATQPLNINDTVAIGTNSQVTADNGVALGAYSQATAYGAVALGSGATASGYNSVAIGLNASATQDNQIVIGAEGTTTQVQTLNVATGATINGGATVNGGLKVGAQSNVSMGNNVVHDVAAPVLDTDAANKAYVDTAVGATAGAVAANKAYIDNGLTKANQRIDKAYEGVAIAMAVQNPVLTGSDRFGVSVNWGEFAGSSAFGAAAVGIVGQNLLGTGEKLGLTGGIGGSNNQVAGRVGLQLTW